MTGRWTLALFVTLLVFTSRAASAGGEGERTPGQFALASDATPSIGSAGYSSEGRRTRPYSGRRLGTTHSVSPATAIPPLQRTSPTAPPCRWTWTPVPFGIPLMSCWAVLPATRTAQHILISRCPPRGAQTTRRAPSRCAWVATWPRPAATSKALHGAPVLSGTGDGATCNDCHSPNGSGHSTSRAADLGAVGPAEIGGRELRAVPQGRARDLPSHRPRQAGPTRGQAAGGHLHRLPRRPCREHHKRCERSRGVSTSRCCLPGVPPGRGRAVRRRMAGP